MTDMTQTDLHKDIGRMEGQLAAMEDRFDRMETTLERIDTRLARIEARESELRGAWWVLAAIATVIGVGLANIVNHFWK